MTLAEQIKKGESKILELKKQLPKNESIAKTVIAFSNTGGGKLVIGVNDQLEVVGVDDTDMFEMQDKVASIVADNCSPDIIPEIYSVNIHNKLVLGESETLLFKKPGKSRWNIHSHWFYQSSGRPEYHC